ncbi:PR domain zinc finger protein 5-like [Haliotis asinina]|uniref:PR domain zinc finger protein 5-like n=1 Tax=Haliotis asinina TaxID=109174 RepID=UPI0035321923
MENVKIKVEPGVEDPRQDVSQMDKPYAMKLQTEEGEVIVVKQEEEDDEIDYGGPCRTSSLNKSGLGETHVKVKSGKNAGSLLRSALIDLSDKADDHKNDANCLSSKAVPSKFALNVKIKKEKDSEHDSRSKTMSAGISPGIGSGHIPIKVGKSSSSDKPTANVGSNVSDRVVIETTNRNLDEDREKAKNLVVSSDAAKALFKAAADIGTKAKAEKSSTIKIVFDVAGKLKEWRVEAKSAEGALPASNLGKILMFANMMKNGDSSLEQEAKSGEEKKDKVKKVVKEVLKPKEEVVTGKSQPSLPRKRTESESAEPPPKKIRICEDGTSGIVDADFEGFKCKICGKEYLHKPALTNHLKLHHLSLSGLPGSSADYSVPQASVVKVKHPASAIVASSSRTKSNTPTALSTSSTKTPSSSTASSASSSTSTFSSASASTPLSTRICSSTEKKKYDTSLPPRPVTLVSSSTISKLGPAVPESKTVQIKQFVAVNKPVFTNKPTTALTLVPAQKQNDHASEACSETFVKTEQLSASKSSSASSSDGPYKCDLCFEEFSRHAALQGHMKSHHKKKPFMCGICDNSYLRYSDLECHLLNHSNPNPKSQVLFTCSICVEEFKTDEDLQEHLKTHGDIEAETVFECGMCGEELKSQLELRHHMKRHMGDPFEPCKCGICLCSFSEVADLKTHLAEKHFTNAQFVCDLCKCRFLTGQALKAHMPVHEKLKDSKIKMVPRWKCKLCSTGYEFKADLVNHMKFKHKDTGTFDCSFCELVFMTKNDLQAHIKTHSVVAHFL